MASTILQSASATVADSSGTIPDYNFPQFTVRDLEAMTVAVTIAAGTWGSETVTHYLQRLGEDGVWVNVATIGSLTDNGTSTLTAFKCNGKLNNQNPNNFRIAQRYSPGTGTISLPTTVTVTAVGW